MEVAALPSGPIDDELVGLDAHEGLLTAEEHLEEFLDFGDVGRATGEDDLMDVSLLEVSVAEDLLDVLESLAEEIVVEFLKLGASDGFREVLAPEEGLDLDVNGILGGEDALGLLSLVLEPGHDRGVLDDVLTVVLLSPGSDEVLNETAIEIPATQMSITGGGQDFEDSFLGQDERDIEGAATEIVDEDIGFVFELIEVVCKGGGRGLVEDAINGETGNGAGVLDGLTLGIVEVGGDGDEDVGDLKRMEIEEYGKLASTGHCHSTFFSSLRNLLHPGQHHRINILGRENLVLAFHLDLEHGLTLTFDYLEGEALHVRLYLRIVKPTTQQVPGVQNRTVRIRMIMALGGVTEQAHIIGEGDVGGYIIVALIVGD
ncbi:LOW QUALITY PROTEIN: NAD-specific glutamate dehydrogenase-domain-containing protein [Jimgerdemannia flammicorona]|uniref:NAD-specific glutamate dehydrogenase-domain-containing protein n=1 Tax=Jimgerdemannia flammicorona TaxID=994334 RepID=A0A433Q4K2_9FUNG|nr:LOW QUALITY PROTEIN: NAD-specific glutamate dehydrogenase-domain-containing protein [Jimgerdemannia flammicorona]